MQAVVQTDTPSHPQIAEPGSTSTTARARPRAAQHRISLHACSAARTCGRWRHHSSWSCKGTRPARAQVARAVPARAARPAARHQARVLVLRLACAAALALLLAADARARAGSKLAVSSRSLPVLGLSGRTPAEQCTGCQKHYLCLIRCQAGECSVGVELRTLAQGSDVPK